MPTTSEDLQGACACGHINYRLTARPMFVHCCHCRDCQRQTGTAFVINALIEADCIQVRNELDPVAVPTDSGKPHRIFRCPQCQIALWSEYGGLEKLRFVRVGTLREPSAVSPDVHIYTRSKLPWVNLPPDVPAFEAYYRASQVWPPEALERRKRALG